MQTLKGSGDPITVAGKLMAKHGHDFDIYRNRLILRALQSQIRSIDITKPDFVEALNNHLQRFELALKPIGDTLELAHFPSDEPTVRLLIARLSRSDAKALQEFLASDFNPFGYSEDIFNYQDKAAYYRSHFRILPSHHQRQLSAEANGIRPPHLELNRHKITSENSTEGRRKARSKPYILIILSLIIFLILLINL